MEKETIRSMLRAAESSIDEVRVMMVANGGWVAYYGPRDIGERQTMAAFSSTAELLQWLTANLAAAR